MPNELHWNYIEKKIVEVFCTVLLNWNELQSLWGAQIWHKRSWWKKLHLDPSWLQWPKLAFSPLLSHQGVIRLSNLRRMPNSISKGPSMIKGSKRLFQWYLTSYICEFEVRFPYYLSSCKNLEDLIHRVKWSGFKYRLWCMFGILLEVSKPLPISSAS